jgi:Arylsulfotransferase (ASST)
LTPGSDIEYRLTDSILSMVLRRILKTICAGAILAVLAGATPALADDGGRPLTISPAQGTPDASPETQISILGVNPQRIRAVKATGSVTGIHRGSLHDYASSPGASFVPDQAFAQGERVKLVVRIRHRRPVRRTFTIANLGPVQPVLNLKQQQPEKLQHFASEPDLLPPRIDVNKDVGGTRGRVFLTPLPSPIVHPGSHNTIEIHPVGPGGPMIVDGNGNLVWFKQLDPPDVAANLRIQKFRGRRVLTWWQGGVTPSAFGIGEGMIANRSYRTIRTVHAGNGYDMDIHEFTLTPGGDALFTVYVPIMVHLPGSPSGTLSPLLDSIVQEVDVRTGLVVWEWHSYGHIPLADSYATPENSASYDAYHINSIQHLKHGRILVSARDTSAVYKIDQASGRILWTLGGRANDFQHRHDARFWFQHDAQLLPDHRIGLFDDEAGPPKKGPFSRGLVLDLNTRQRSAKVDQQYYRSTTTSAQSEGSLQLRDSGNVFVGFGSAPFFSEFSPGGRLLYDGSLPKDDGTYRTFRYRWHADPQPRPKLAVQLQSQSKVAAFASWNGATAVRRWQLLAGPEEEKLRPIGSARSTGFETEIDANRAGVVYAVRAIDSDGHVLATSEAVQPS